MYNYLLLLCVIFVYVKCIDNLIIGPERHIIDNENPNLHILPINSGARNIPKAANPKINGLNVNLIQGNIKCCCPQQIQSQNKAEICSVFDFFLFYLKMKISKNEGRMAMEWRVSSSLACYVYKYLD
ncbi:PREDICTED: uncharacterized protein LOC106123850 [Papilio xuthus]|uniref:Uncharacterized protein LOC106123850 n=1 Tax=Papilio xuthus TaxID=66420 RepID=A0AAJ6ZME7_PAPXU|nr:PREDICTED: uncharacterized protein LOC106123850 [Papilio xuthus]